MNEPLSVDVEVDPAVYRLDAIKKAAYRLGDRCFVALATRSDGRVVVTLTPKNGSVQIQQVRGEFQNEMLDQELREVVGKETEAVRNVLLAQAFSKTSLLDPIGDAANFRDDPLNIRAPDKRK